MLSATISTQIDQNAKMRQQNASVPEGLQAIAAPLLLQYWQVVLRWRWIIAAIITAALLAGFVATLLMTPQFTAKSRIEISRDQKNVTKVEGIDSGESSRD